MLLRKYLSVLYNILSVRILTAYFYSNNLATSPPEIKFQFQKKFQPKVMFYVAVLNAGVPQPYFMPSGLAINQNVYQNECFLKTLIPFIKKYHGNGNYIFWPDKASAHYAKGTTDFLISINIQFVPKDRNPTNFPQFKPIKDFFGELSSLVYRKCWIARNVKQLKTKIKKCLKEMNRNGVQKACPTIKTKCAILLTMDQIL